MKKSFQRLALCAITVAAFTTAQPAVALHEQPGHAQLTRDALPRSDRFESALAEAGLGELELSDEWTALARTVPGILIAGRAAADLVVAGSVLEDGVPSGVDGWVVTRCLRHFQDTGGHGLGPSPAGINLPSAQQWGSGTSGSTWNTFTWPRAQQDYATALLGEEAETRREAFERALIALGCNLHLLQDQYSPAHTRDDPHPGHHIPLGEFLFGSSLLETSGRRFLRYGHNAFESEPVPVIAKSTHAAYFDDAVQWTATRFFSDDTIFEFGQVPTEVSVGYSDDDTCWVIPDQYVVSTTLGVEGTKLAYSLLGLGPLLGWSLQASPCDPSGELAIVEANLRRLVPRAIGSSAGLIDHFFRGKLLVEQDAQGNLEIKNGSASFGSGWNTFQSGLIRIAVEDPDTLERTLVHEQPLPQSGLAAGESLVIPANVLLGGAPPTGPTARLAIVYVGGIGEEDGVAGAMFEYSVPTTLCEELCVPYQYSILRPAGDIDGDGAPDLVRSNRFQWLTGDPWATVYSSNGCQEILEIALDQYAEQDLHPDGDSFGIGDVDGDGHGDLLLTSTGAPGWRMVWVSGADLELGEPLPDPWGWSTLLAGSLGDLDGDGRGEFFAWYGFSYGVFSAEPMQLRWQGAGFPERFVDVNADGITDLRVHYQDSSLLVDGSDGTYLQFPTDPDAGYEWWGHHQWIPVRDVDGDGVPDLLGIGGTEYSIHTEIGLHSGLDGSSMWHLDLPGSVVQGALWLGDWDGDGHDDCAIRMWEDGAYRYHLISSVDGSDLVDPRSTAPPLVQCVVGAMGDVNGDGIGDYLCEEHGLPGPSCYHFLLGGGSW